MTDDFLRAFLSFFAIIDPVGNVMVFHVLTRRLSLALRLTIAAVSVVAAFAMMVVFSFAGEGILDYLNISTASFQVAAGALLVLPALRLVERGEPLPASSEFEEGDPLQLAFVPLATPLLAGPGALATTISFTATVGRANTLTAAALVMVLALVAFAAAAWLFDLLGPSILRLLSRLVGILLMAIAADLILEGLRVVFENGGL